MKKAKIVASVVLAAALSTTMFAAACGKEDKGGHTKDGAEFKLAEYAHALDSKYAEENRYDYAKNNSNIHDAFTGVIKKSYKNLEKDGSSDFAIATVANEDADDTYTLYDIKNDKELFTGYDRITRQSGYFEHFVLIKKNASDKYEYQYVGPDGKTVIGPKFTEDTKYVSSHIDIDSLPGYTDEEGNIFRFYSVTYTTGTGANEKEVEKFFCIMTDEDGVVTFKEVKEADTEIPEEESEYPAGTQLGLTRRELGDSELFPSQWDGIEYTVEGNLSSTYTYYKNDTKLSSFSIKNGSLIGHVGNYAYFVEMEAVGIQATDGYNVEALTEYYSGKAMYTLYRYDFVNAAAEAEEVKTDYVVMGGTTRLYNYTTKKYDKLVVTAVKKENGVAIYNVASKTYRLILDEDFNISADISDKNVESFNFYKLKDNRFLSGNTIVDGDLNIVAQLPGNNPRVWADRSLIVCNSSGTMFVDFDGKVVVEPVYGTLRFYGDVAYNTSDYKFYSAAHPSGIELDELVKYDEETEEVYYLNGVIAKVTTVVDKDGELPTTLTLTLYDLAGKQIGKLTNVKTDSMSSLNNAFNTTYGGKYVLRITVYTDLATNKTETAYWLVG